MINVKTALNTVVRIKYLENLDFMKSLYVYDS